MTTDEGMHSSSANVALAHSSDRDLFLELTKGQVEFVELEDGRKSPDTKVHHSIKEYAKKCPQRKNVGAHPINNTVIFDLDNKSGRVTAEEQIVSLEKIYGFDLNNTLTVATPSGGLHVYTIWPKNVTLPYNWPLSVLSGKEYIFEGDIRAPARKGHAVMPGSEYENIPYKLQKPLPLVQLSEEAAEAFINHFQVVKKLDKNNQLKTTDNSLNKSINNDDAEVDFTLKAFERVNDKKLSLLKLALAKKNYRHWHQARAFVYNYLNCCYCDQTILEYWLALGICKDTSQGHAQLKMVHTKNEFTTLDKSERHHGPYCLLNFKNTRVLPEVSPEELAKLTLSAAKIPRRWHDVKVVDLPRAVIALNRMSRKAQKNTKTYQLAIAILEDFFQPWHNFGKSAVLLNDDFVASFYGVTPGLVSDAKRKLRKAGIIRVFTVQAEGRTSSFTIEADYIDFSLSKVLKAVQMSFPDRDIKIDSRAGIFYDDDSNEAVSTIDKLQLVSSHNIDVKSFHDTLPPRLSEYTVTKLLK